MSSTDLTVAEVAERLRVSVFTVWREIKDGRIKATRSEGVQGRPYVIGKGAYDAYLIAQTIHRQGGPVADTTPQVRVDTVEVSDIRIYELDDVHQMTGLSKRSLSEWARRRRYEFTRIGNRPKLTGLQLRALLAQLADPAAPDVDPHAADRRRAARAAARPPRQRRT